MSLSRWPNAKAPAFCRALTTTGAAEPASREIFTSFW
jgi:hypothetical protein